MPVWAHVVAVIAVWVFGVWCGDKWAKPTIDEIKAAVSEVTGIAVSVKKVL